MRLSLIHILIFFLFPSVAFAQGSTDLLSARKGHKTKLTKKNKATKGLPAPKGPFKLVSYPGALGKMGAYLSQPQKPKQKYPAMIWITGGFPSGGIGSSAWERTRRDNDQSAKSYRYSGMIMMYPTFRGDAGNPGTQEGFYGEVDDVLSAAKYLAKQDFVDPNQIYLGGHSTGGTLALLAATSGYKFKAVISFGPVDEVAGYGAEALPFDVYNEKESKLRAPIHYLNGIQCPTFVIEGDDGGNAAALIAMKKVNKNPKIQFIVVKGAGHFNILAPINDYLAAKISKAGKDAELKVSAKEIQDAFNEEQTANREASDLETLAQLRQAGVNLRKVNTVRYFLYSRAQKPLDEVGKSLTNSGFSAQSVQRKLDRNKRPYFLLIVEKDLKLIDLEAVFQASKAVTRSAAKFQAQYDGWSTK